MKDEKPFVIKESMLIKISVAFYVAGVLTGIALFAVTSFTVQP